MASAEDAPRLARLHVEGWRGAYGGIVDQTYLDGLTVDRRASDWRGWLAAGESRTFIAEQDGQAAGFVAWGRTRTPPPGSSPIRPSHAAEIYALYLHPDFWRRGIGTALLSHAAVDMKERKQVSACLWVLDANARAKAFYVARGGQKLGGKIVEIGPSALKEVAFGWRDITTLI